MAFFRLSENQAINFDSYPETAMGLHITFLSGVERVPAFVLGGTVLLIPDRHADREISELMRQPWLRNDGEFSNSDSEFTFKEWLYRLGEAPELDIPENRGALLNVNYLRFVDSEFETAIIPPGSTYGHLPFTRTTGKNDVFYRCEPWPVSRRIDQHNRQIAKDTFAFPLSELPLVPSGFSAVGRYALPNLAPACFRWELQPIAGTTIRCGASVPLYGQAGGGVEVCFTGITPNRGPIANPILLPEL